jgi:hypothetical protein
MRISSQISPHFPHPRTLHVRSYTHCVILAGTNDVSQDSPENIFKHICTPEISPWTCHITFNVWFDRSFVEERFHAPLAEVLAFNPDVICPSGGPSRNSSHRCANRRFSTINTRGARLTFKATCAPSARQSAHKLLIELPVPPSASVFILLSMFIRKSSAPAKYIPPATLRQQASAYVSICQRMTAYVRCLCGSLAHLPHATLLLMQRAHRLRCPTLPFGPVVKPTTGAHEPY